jgi:hypothetical protein
MKASPFSRAFLLMLFGPMVWAAHFLVIYGFTGIACARGLQQAEWLGMNIVTWVIAATAFVAVAAILLLAWQGGYKSTNNTARDNASFTRWMTAGLGFLSIVAIVWESITVLLVPACA